MKKRSSTVHLILALTWAIALLVASAAPAHAKDVNASPEPAAASCAAPAVQASSVPLTADSGKSATIAAQVAATIRPGVGRPVSVQNKKLDTKEMVFLDKIATSAKLSASLAEVDGSEECTELGLVWDPSGPVGCSETLGACFETGVAPCTDAPGIPEDTFCASWACRWW